jgi:chromosome segregation ATPase
MDYLLSLVGKDQDTIIDAIKDLAANAEKVKSQEVEVKELNEKLDENKEEIHYLKNKLDQKYDVIDDIENDLDKTERKLKETKNNLELKEVDLNRLEMLITEQVEEINIFKPNNLSMVSQIGENIQMGKRCYQGA